MANNFVPLSAFAGSIDDDSDLEVNVGATSSSNAVFVADEFGYFSEDDDNYHRTGKRGYQDDGTDLIIPNGNNEDDGNVYIHGPQLQWAMLNPLSVVSNRQKQRSAIWDAFDLKIERRYRLLPKLFDVMWKFVSSGADGNEKFERTESVPIVHFANLVGVKSYLNIFESFDNDRKHKRNDQRMDDFDSTYHNDEDEQFRRYRSRPWYYLCVPETQKYGILAIPYNVFLNTSIINENGRLSKEQYSDHSHFPLSLMRDELFHVLKLRRTVNEHVDLIFPRIKFESATDLDDSDVRNMKHQLTYERAIPIPILPLWLSVAPKEWISLNGGIAAILFELRHKINCLRTCNATNDRRTIDLIDVSLQQFDANVERVFAHESMLRQQSELLMQSVVTNNQKIDEIKSLLKKISLRLDKIEQTSKNTNM